MTKLDRISISFVKGNQESAALFSTTMGMGLVTTALKYGDYIMSKAHTPPDYEPMAYLDPGAVLFCFIAHLTLEEGIIHHGMRIGRNDHEGDNTENGHFYINLDCIAARPSRKTRKKMLLNA